MNARSSHNQRLLPAVERVLNAGEVVELCRRHGRSVVADWVREILDDLRSGRGGELPDDPSAIFQGVVDSLHGRVRRDDSLRLRRVINGTGIVIHTNLGRAPLAAAAVRAMTEVASCTNLEVDLAAGRRGRRGAAAEALCRQITGAEDALVVNNCASATLLTLHTLAAGRGVVISRGQLVEIGGSYRLPDVFAQASVTLREVGTTNRTRLSDYEAAVDQGTAALLRVHPSNYRITGFSEEVPIAELVELAHAHQLPAIDDVGSGCLYDLTRFGLPDESIVGNSVRAGADLVLFSGDKLLGGPQCGIAVGRADVVERLRANPLARAVRVDKLTLAALEATLEIHRAGRAFAEIPVLRQLSWTADEIKTTAERLVGRLRAASRSPEAFSLQAVESAPGGGAYAGQTVPSWAIAIGCSQADEVARRLRLGAPAVMPRLNEGCVLIDMRTVLPEDEEALVLRLLECDAESTAP
jgi:L-seryl-tRNA(Ser) seleniumtransferase